MTSAGNTSCVYNESHSGCAWQSSDTHTSSTEATAKTPRQGHVTRRSRDMEAEEEGGEAERDFPASKSDPERLTGDRTL